MTAPHEVRPTGDVPVSRGDGERARLLAGAARTIDAPDLVIALSHRGRRMYQLGGGMRPDEAPRYELGSASKPFTGLLLAALVAGLAGCATRTRRPNCWPPATPYTPPYAPSPCAI